MGGSQRPFVSNNYQLSLHIFSDNCSIILIMRIGFCYNIKHNDGQGYASELDFDAPETINDIAKSLEEIGHTVKHIEVVEDIFSRLAYEKSEIDIVFNIAEGLWGDARESWVPLACEVHKIPYTHSTPSVLALCLDKTLTKLAVSGLGVRVPKSFLVSPGQPLPSQIKFPVIIKPNAEGSSVGIFDANVVNDLPALTARLEKL